MYGGCPEEDRNVDTLVPVWAGADWYEREAYDLYGVRFNGHPDLRRILMYPEFVGHPLRKDYPKEKRQPLVRRQPVRRLDLGGPPLWPPRDTRAGRGRLSRKPNDLGRRPICRPSPSVNMGPSTRPCTAPSGWCWRSRARRIANADIQIGFLHRCFEKESEAATWTQVFPYTDRLNYISPMLNNVGYAMAVEKLIGLEVPERAQYIRVIVGEVSRITDHLTCLGACAMELGAFTVFLYVLKAREWLFELLEEVWGARLTSSYLRIGGVSYDLPEGFDGKLRDILARTNVVMQDSGLLDRNRIFRDRMDGIGIITKAAPSLRRTGPVAARPA